MIRPNAEYAGQTDNTDPAFPHGKARNATVTNDGTGFPLEKGWVNDLLGAKQALVAEAGIEPSNAPDGVGASDELDALDTLFYRKGTIDAAIGTRVISSAAFFTCAPVSGTGATALSQVSTTGAGYTLQNSNTELLVPLIGLYLIQTNLLITSDSTSSNFIVGAEVKRNGSSQFFVQGVRKTTSASELVSCSGSVMVFVANVAHPLTFHARAATGTGSISAGGGNGENVISIQRVS